MKTARLTHARLLDVLGYDRETGIFTWLVQTSRRISVGDEAGVIATNGYRYIAIDNEKFCAHRLAVFYVTGRWPVGQVDHKDTVRSNNTFDNLRDATQSQNSANGVLRSTNKSGFKGVSWCNEKSKWVAGIKINYRRKFLGYFDSPEAANAVYMREASRLFGEFARAA